MKMVSFVNGNPRPNVPTHVRCCAEETDPSPGNWRAKNHKKRRPRCDDNIPSVSGLIDLVVSGHER
jgi:hypothetical protein